MTDAGSGGPLRHLRALAQNVPTKNGTEDKREILSQLGADAL